MIDTTPTCGAARDAPAVRTPTALAVSNHLTPKGRVEFRRRIYEQLRTERVLIDACPASLTNLCSCGGVYLT
jgi:hypothetical protein